MANGMSDPTMLCGLHGTHPTLSHCISSESEVEMMGVKIHGIAAVDAGAVFHGIFLLDCEGHESFKEERGRE